MASNRRGPQYMPVLASFIACNVHASKTCVQSTLLHTLLGTHLLVAHVILHIYKCTIMPSVFYSNAALEPYLLHCRTISAAVLQRVCDALQSAGLQSALLFCRQTSINVLHAHHTKHGLHMHGVNISSGQTQ